MKLNNKHKINKDFDPANHWYLLFTIICIIFTIVVFYALYSFFYIKSEIALIEIESKNNVQNSTSSDYLEKSRNNNKFLKDINNLNKTLDEYERKEIEYNRLINNEVKGIISTSTSTFSTTVATSTQ